MNRQLAPVFNADSAVFQNIGLLKVSEFAMRQCGDTVQIHASETRNLYLLGGADSVTYWRGHQGHFRADFGDIASNDAITLMLVGSLPQEERWKYLWMKVGRKMTALAADIDQWLADAAAAASRAFVADALKKSALVDLRDLCREWSVRAVFPALLGTSLTDAEIADGMDHVEYFYLSMGTKGPAAVANYESLPEYRTARDFLDRLITVALDNMRPGDSTLLAHLAGIIPADVDPADRLGLLRPALAQVLTEKLNVGGRSLLWVLAHLAQSPDLTDAIASEPDKLQGQDGSLGMSAAHEGMRLYPELPFIYRITRQEVPIGLVTIPQHATVIFSPWLVQRDKRYWSTPAEFDARRFIDARPDPDHYFPFGVGPRIRTRARFILGRLSEAIRTITTELRFSLAPDCPRGNLRPLLRSALVPRGAINLMFSSRNDPGAKSEMQRLS